MPPEILKVFLTFFRRHIHGFYQDLGHDVKTDTAIYGIRLFKLLPIQNNGAVFRIPRRLR